MRCTTFSETKIESWNSENLDQGLIYYPFPSSSFPIPNPLGHKPDSTTSTDIFLLIFLETIKCEIFLTEKNNELVNELMNKYIFVRLTVLIFLLMVRFWSFFSFVFVGNSGTDLTSIFISHFFSFLRISLSKLKSPFTIKILS